MNDNNLSKRHNSTIFHLQDNLYNNHNERYQQCDEPFFSSYFFLLIFCLFGIKFIVRFMMISKTRLLKLSGYENVFFRICIKIIFEAKNFLMMKLEVKIFLIKHNEK